MAVWREGVTGALAGNAVDITLRFGRRYRVAHMPTTTTTATDALRREACETRASPWTSNDRAASEMLD